ncbi:MAG: hypothetical protein RLY43_2080 [Bacteroidota bacterium]
MALFYKTMSKKIKLIWDFRGPSALQTAEHHAIHLNEYLNLENYVLQLTGFESIDEFYSIAYIVVEEKDMLKFRDKLKPHRGEWYE